MSITDDLVSLLRQREQRGIETYGETLRPFNGRDATQDAIEEALDLAQYLRQWQMERAALSERIAELEAENARLRNSR